MLKRLISLNLKSDADKIDIDKFKNIPYNSRNLKRKVEKIDVYKLVPVPVDLNKLSDVVKNDIVEKNVYDAKIKDIEDKILDIANLASNTTLKAKVNEVKNEIPSIINLATNTSLNAKTNEVKGEIPGITNLATTTAFTTAENKIPNFSDLLKKKIDYDAKISEMEQNILVLLIVISSRVIHLMRR